MSRVVITGNGAICGVGAIPCSILDALLAGHSALAPITSFNAEPFRGGLAAEVLDYDGGKLLGDRKSLKLVRRSDVFGIYAGTQAIEQAGLTAWRAMLVDAEAAQYSDQTGCYVGSGGGSAQVNYDFFSLMAETQNDLSMFGRELSNMVNPMWLLRSLPNSVLCRLSIRDQLKGPNGCITNHATSGLLSLIESAWALREGDGLSHAIEFALVDTQLTPADVGMIVAHGDGTQESDASEAKALLQVFGSEMPPVTGLNWAVGHLFAAAGLFDLAIGLEACRRRVVPGISNLEQLADSCAGLNVSKQARTPRSDVVLVLCRGFAGTNAAVLLRAIE